MKYRVSHSTAYSYSDPVTSHNLLHLKPRKTGQQECLHSEISISPPPKFTSDRQDYFGNTVTYFSIEERHDALKIRAVSEVSVAPFVPPLVEFTPPWEDVRDRLAELGPAHVDAIQYLHESEHVKFDPELREYAEVSFTPRRPVLEAVMDLTHRIHKEFTYDRTATSITTAPLDILRMRKGVCQDFTHLEIACLRSLGIAARYISGYLQTNPAGDQQKLVGADASHAWLAFYCPEFGWIAVDPTNDLVPSDKHIVASWGRDYADVSPVKGVVLGGGRHTMSVAVEVTPI
jgi:transglutaminase-like putative cysteine protease